MRVDFNRTLVDFMGHTVLDRDGSPMTLRKASSFALVAALPGDDKAGLDDKLTREGLAARIWQGDAKDLPIEQVAIVKARINIAFPSPLLVAAAIRILEGADDYARVAPDEDRTTPVRISES